MSFPSKMETNPQLQVEYQISGSKGRHPRYNRLLWERFSVVRPSL